MSLVIYCNAAEEGRYAELREHLLARLVNRANRYLCADCLICERVAALPSLSPEPKIPVRCTDAVTNVPDPLCETLSYRVVERASDGSLIRDEMESLRLPEGATFYDFHIHTPLAYCNENIEFSTLFRLSEAFRLSAIGFSEHSGHLYFPESNYWGSYEWYFRGMDSGDRENRAERYFTQVDPLRSSRCAVGMEIDVDAAGRLLIEPADATRLQYRIGAVHYVPEIFDSSSDAAVGKALLRQTHALLDGGIDILAHPLREFVWFGRDIPAGLAEAVADLLRRYQCASELNFHQKPTPDSLVRACLEAGVPFTFGGDVHALYELGEFYPQLKQMSRIAPEVSPDEYLLAYHKIID